MIVIILIQKRTFLSYTLIFFCAFTFFFSLLLKFKLRLIIDELKWVQQKLLISFFLSWLKFDFDLEIKFDLLFYNNKKMAWRFPNLRFLAWSFYINTFILHPFYRIQSYPISLPPDLVCRGCTLRLVRQATEWGNRYIFWSCADVDIVKSKSSLSSFINLFGNHVFAKYNLLFTKKSNKKKSKVIQLSKKTIAWFLQ